MELTCIVCPMGCRITVETVGGETKVSGNTCKRGEKYAVQEVVCPMRTLTTLVRLRGGESPLCPVKTDKPIPKSAIGAALKAAKKVCADSPVRIGDVLVQNIAGTDANLVATANRERRS